MFKKPIGSWFKIELITLTMVAGTILFCMIFIQELHASGLLIIGAIALYIVAKLLFFEWNSLKHPR